MRHIHPAHQAVEGDRTLVEEAAAAVHILAELVGHNLVDGLAAHSPVAEAAAHSLVAEAVVHNFAGGPVDRIPVVVAAVEGTVDDRSHQGQH